MLQSLTVRNFVIVDELELDFTSGFTVLTGETGAGKSILIDALAIALGERADADVIREGATRAEVAAEFRVNAAAAAWVSATLRAGSRSARQCRAASKREDMGEARSQEIVDRS